MTPDYESGEPRKPPMPPSRDRGRPQMNNEEDESVSSMLRRQRGDQGGSAKVMQAANILVEAAKENPQLQAAVEQCLTILQGAASQGGAPAGANGPGMGDEGMIPRPPTPPQGGGMGEVG